jgi:hypothetical protein
MVTISRSIRPRPGSPRRTALTPSLQVHPRAPLSRTWTTHRGRCQAFLDPFWWIALRPGATVTTFHQILAQKGNYVFGFEYHTEAAGPLPTSVANFAAHQSGAL